MEAGSGLSGKMRAPPEDGAAMGVRRRAGAERVDCAANSSSPVYAGTAKHGLAAAGSIEASPAAGAGADGLHTDVRLPAPALGMAAGQPADALAVRADLNFYIWHQFLAVQYVRNWFPNTLHSDPGLQWAFTVLCYASTLVLAAALTAVTDRVADWGKALWKRKK